MYVLRLICVKTCKKVALKSKISCRKVLLVWKIVVPLHPLNEKRRFE